MPALFNLPRTMRKLRLKLDDLEVESFSVPEGKVVKGTVRGHGPTMATCDATTCSGGLPCECGTWEVSFCLECMTGEISHCQYC